MGHFQGHSSRLYFNVIFPSFHGQCDIICLKTEKSLWQTIGGVYFMLRAMELVELKKSN